MNSSQSVFDSMSVSESKYSSLKMNCTAFELCPSWEQFLGGVGPLPPFLVGMVGLDGGFGGFGGSFVASVKDLAFFRFSQTLVICEPSDLQNSHFSLSLGVLQSF